MKNRNGKLFIIATPIGNLADITLRALDTLKIVDLIICEDTRVTSKLLKAYGIEKKLFVYNDNSGQQERDKIIQNLMQGLNIALVSDAGTPLISDPGYKLIQDLNRNNIKIETLPGACSIIAALTIAGLPTNSFMFIGFLPHKQKAKEDIFMGISNIDTTIICFESANRLLESIEIAINYFSNREFAVAREITKIFEEVIRGKAEEVIKYYQENTDKLRGEVVLLIGPPNGEELNLEEKAKMILKDLLTKMSVRDAVEIASSQIKLSRKIIYKLALELAK
ncbi:MAG: 16S rRNA (cytidine(1402)-2'-O)-methyltransferase [Pseudomonadota bacterium]